MSTIMLANDLGLHILSHKKYAKTIEVQHGDREQLYQIDDKDKKEIIEFFKKARYKEQARYFKYDLHKARLREIEERVANDKQIGHAFYSARGPVKIKYYSVFEISFTHLIKKNDWLKNITRKNEFLRNFLISQAIIKPTPRVTKRLELVYYVLI